MLKIGISLGNFFNCECTFVVRILNGQLPKLLSSSKRNLQCLSPLSLNLTSSSTGKFNRSYLKAICPALALYVVEFDCYSFGDIPLEIFLLHIFFIHHLVIYRGLFCATSPPSPCHVGRNTRAWWRRLGLESLSTSQVRKVSCASQSRARLRETRD